MSTHQPALSPSRAKDYLQCPLKFRFAVVDRIPQPPTEATMKGTLVHAVLEKLFTLPAPNRTPEQAESLIAPVWQELLSSNASYTECLDDALSHTILQDASKLVQSYFNLERPNNLAPAKTEGLVNATLPSGVHLRGIIDRIDQAPDGRLRVVDYKTGKAPSPRYINEALFQMRYYALLLQLVDKLPSRTQLLYLKTGDVLTLDPSSDDIADFAEEVDAIWGRIRSNLESQSFQPMQGPLCGWCSFKPLCPAFGGEPGDPKDTDIARVLSIQASN